MASQRRCVVLALISLLAAAPGSCQELRGSTAAPSVPTEAAAMPGEGDPVTEKTVFAGEGELCTRGDVADARLCMEGLICSIIDQGGEGYGTCIKHSVHLPPIGSPRSKGNDSVSNSEAAGAQPAPAAGGEAVHALVRVGEGERCTRGLAPEHSRLCSEGLACHAEDEHLIGGAGVCVAIAHDAESSSSSTGVRASLVWVGEGERCTRGLAPQYSRLCQEGLVCHTERQQMGGSGVCSAAAAAAPLWP